MAESTGSGKNARDHEPEQNRESGQATQRMGFGASHTQEVSAPKLAHELRTRLAIIRGSVDNVRDGVFGELNNNQKRYLDIAAESVERMSELVEDLMASMAPGRAPMRIHREPSPVIDIVRTAVESAHSLAYKEGINILANFPKGSPVVLCDRVKIEQVLLNLFRNAIKFTSRGGAITVSVAEKDDFVEIKVSDTGVGIPQEKLDSLFEEKDPSVVRTADGGYRTSGLGLVIVKNILDAHNSRISVSSRIGKGTQVSFTLPLSR